MQGIFSKHFMVSYDIVATLLGWFFPFWVSFNNERTSKFESIATLSFVTSILLCRPGLGRETALPLSSSDSTALFDLTQFGNITRTRLVSRQKIVTCLSVCRCCLIVASDCGMWACFRAMCTRMCTPDFQTSLLYPYMQGVFHCFSWRFEVTVP